MVMPSNPNGRQEPTLLSFDDARISLGPQNLVVACKGQVFLSLCEMHAFTTQRRKTGRLFKLLDGDVNPSAIWAQPEAWVTYLNWTSPEILS